MKIVIDTNILVAAGFNDDSAAADVVDRARRGKLQVVWNDATRAESRSVITSVPPRLEQRW